MSEAHALPPPAGERPSVASVAPAPESPAPSDTGLLAGPPAAVPAPPRRGRKLVITLQPLPAGVTRAYRAVLAVGADGCDPVLVAAEVDGLLEAVAAAPALVADAQERWRAQPRNPGWRPARGASNGARAEGPATATRRRNGQVPDAPVGGLWPAGAETHGAGAAGPEASPLPGRPAAPPADGGAPPSGAPPPSAPSAPSAPAQDEPARFGRVATTAQLPLFGE